MSMVELMSVWAKLLSHCGACTPVGPGQFYHVSSLILPRAPALVPERGPLCAPFTVALAVSVPQASAFSLQRSFLKPKTWPKSLFYFVCGCELGLIILLWIKIVFSLLGSKGFSELRCSVSIWLLHHACGNCNWSQDSFLENGVGVGAVQTFPSPSQGTALLAVLEVTVAHGIISRTLFWCGDGESNVSVRV